MENLKEYVEKLKSAREFNEFIYKINIQILIALIYIYKKNPVRIHNEDQTPFAMAKIFRGKIKCHMYTLKKSKTYKKKP